MSEAKVVHEWASYLNWCHPSDVTHMLFYDGAVARDGSPVRGLPNYLSIELARLVERERRLREALECCEYALANPSSDQDFALNAARAALEGGSDE